MASVYTVIDRNTPPRSVPQLLCGVLDEDLTDLYRMSLHRNDTVFLAPLSSAISCKAVIDGKEKNDHAECRNENEDSVRYRDKITPQIMALSLLLDNE
jgi:hypothetical protein